jgi:hypothetical protein
MLPKGSPRSPSTRVAIPDALLQDSINYPTCGRYSHVCMLPVTCVRTLDQTPDPDLQFLTDRIVGMVNRTEQAPGQ